MTSFDVLNAEIAGHTVGRIATPLARIYVGNSTLVTSPFDKRTANNNITRHLNWILRLLFSV